MKKFWDEIEGSKIKNGGSSQAWKKLSKEASLRPTIYIGLGGFGCTVVRKLKKSIHDLIPDNNTRGLFAFIGIDTHARERRDVLSANEYVPLSVGIFPDEVSRDPHYSDHLGWYRDMTAECKWKSPCIESGANKVKALGRISLLYPPTANTFYNTMKSALGNVRRNVDTKEVVKVYIISSLGGGTGSGALVDVSIIVSQMLRKESQANYRLQAILATPDALEDEAPSIDYKDFYANTYATLKELFHFINNERENFSYKCPGPGFESLSIGSEHMPSNIFLITDRNTDGQIIHSTLPALGEMAVSYLLFEIQSPVKTQEGAPKSYDAENTSFGDPGHGLMPRSFSSIGVVQFGFPHEKITELFTQMLALRTIDTELEVRHIEFSFIEGWISSNSLTEVGSDQLQEKIRMDAKGNPIRISLDILGRLKDLKRTELSKACVRLKKSMQTAVNEQFKKVIADNGKNIIKKSQGALEDDLKKWYSDKPLGHSAEFLKNILEALKHHRETLAKELNNSTIKLQTVNNKIDASIQAIAEAAASGFWRRKENIQLNENVFDGNLKTFLNIQLVVWSQQEGLDVYDRLIKFCEGRSDSLMNTYNMLTARNSFLKESLRNQAYELNKLADIQLRGPGNRLSLVDFDMATDLYDEFFDKETEAAAIAKAKGLWKDGGIMTDLKSDDNAWLKKAAAGIAEEVERKLDSFSIIQLLERFFPDGGSRDKLFDRILALGAPLFPVIAGKEEAEYRTDRILAAHPSIQKEVEKLFGGYKKVGEGICNAYFNSPYEIIIYTVKQGFTGHSLTRIEYYKSYYDQLMNSYEARVSERKSHRPLHSWLDADEWDEIIPKPQGEEETNKWFVLGRAFSMLFPSAVGKDGGPDARKNTAFIYNRGSNYYLRTRDGRRKDEVEMKLGNGIEASLEKFESQPDLQNQIRDKVMNQVGSSGGDFITDRLTTDYLPLLNEEIESAKKSREKTRHKMLNRLKTSLDNFIDEDLKQSRA